MKTFWPLLRDGLRLSLLLPPRTSTVTVVYWPLLVLIVLASIITLPISWITVEAPRTFDPDGLQTLLAALALTLLAALVMARLSKRPAMTLTVATWLTAASLPPALLGSLAFVFLLPDPNLFFDPEPLIDWNRQATSGQSGDASLLWLIVIAYLSFALTLGIAALWLLAIYLRLALLLAPDLGRALAAAAASIALSTLPWVFFTQYGLVSTDWMAYYDGDYDDEDEDEDEDDEAYERDYSGYGLTSPEATFYAQPALLNNALEALAPQRPGHIDMYVLGFGGDAEEGAFRNEVDFLPQLASHRLDAADRSLRLINHNDSADSVPLATVTNLERALLGIAERMDVQEDILFLYLTSHGSKRHSLYINQPPLPLDQLNPTRLRKALDDAGIRWRVIVISACYSGGYLNALSDPRTLVITAAHAERTSFGCGNSANATWFGQAFLIDGLNHTANFRSAFLRAQKQVREREESHDYDPSQPQWQAGDKISEHLSRWQDSLPPGQSVAFTPSVQVVDDDFDTQPAWRKSHKKSSAQSPEESAGEAAEENGEEP